MYFKPEAIWPNSLSICEGRGRGGAPLAHRQNMTTVRRATGWPYRRMHSSGSLDVPQQVLQETRLLLLHLQRAGVWPAGPLSSVEADEINLNFTGASFLANHLTLKTKLIFTHSRSAHCLHGLWFWLTRLQRAWVFSHGDSGDKNVRLTPHLWSTSWGEPDTNITRPAAERGLACKQPAEQQMRHRANGCTAGSIHHVLILLSHRSWLFHTTMDAFFNTHPIRRGKSRFGRPLSCLVSLNIE